MHTPLRRGLVAGAVLLLGGLLAAYAYEMAFLCDDAYISFRYARNLKDGFGLIYNPGEWVEGYTNFSWTVLLAATWWLGIGPETSAPIYTSLFTAGCFGLVGWLAARPKRDRWDVAVVIALSLWATNRTVAMWTTSGLETRLFTLFILTAFATSRSSTRRATWATSFALGFAELTRPEALLFGPLILGWTTLRAWRANGFDRTDLIARWTPYTLIVAAHFAFRIVTYGALLPNTFAAKGKELWIEGGLYWASGAFVEYGLFLLLPLGLIGAIDRWRRHDDDLHILGAVLVALHMVFVIRVGGDHFEYRLLDIAFALLAVAVADGLLALARVARRAGPAVLVVGTALAVFYQGILPLMDARASNPITERKARMLVKLEPKHAGVLYNAPLVASMVDFYNTNRHWCSKRVIGTRMVEHRNFRDRQWRFFSPMAPEGRRPLPPGLVTVDGAMGVYPFFYPELTVVDKLGLTDAFVPTRPSVPVKIRALAHTRRDVDDYLESRRNINVHRPAKSAVEGVARFPFAVQLADTVWLPFDSGPERFRDYPVVSRIPFATSIPLYAGRQFWRVVQVLDPFDDSWTLEGRAFRGIPSGKARRGQAPLVRVMSDQVVNSYREKGRDGPTGTLVSPPIQLEEGQRIALTVGGGEQGVGVRLLGSDRVAHGRNDEAVRTHLLGDGKAGVVQIEIFDESDGYWGHVLVDRIAIVGDPTTGYPADHGR